MLISAQTMSGKKDIAVFKLSHSSDVPSEVAARIDQRIIGVVTSFKRFNVIGMQYRLSSSNVASFIDQIKGMKERRLEIPEKLLPVPIGNGLQGHSLYLLRELLPMMKN